MASHVSAAAHQTPHTNRTTRTATIFNALKQRAEAVLNDTSIDAQSRAIIRYGLETNDPWLAQLIDRTDAGENIADSFDFSQTATFSQTTDFSQTAKTNDGSSSKEEIEALAEMILPGWRSICGRTVGAHGDAGKLGESQGTRKPGEILRLDALR